MSYYLTSTTGVGEVALETSTGETTLLQERLVENWVIFAGDSRDYLICGRKIILFFFLIFFRKLMIDPETDADDF